jgi:multimeric flavodoxin WrbA
MEQVKAFLDRLTGKLVSRKFLAWIVATVLATHGMLTSEDWVAVTTMYIGSEALVDLATRWKHGA